MLYLRKTEGVEANLAQTISKGIQRAVAQARAQRRLVRTLSSLVLLQLALFLGFRCCLLAPGALTTYSAEDSVVRVAGRSR